jgi:two-component system cell cycle sensor histidine kinase/response regulator CckA
MLSEQVQRPTLSQSANSRGPGSNGSIGKILVVDDEPELRAALVEALVAQGYQTIGCSSGHKALDELRDHNCDLLLTDLMMPEIDGISLIKAALEVDPHLVAIIMTGQGTIQTAVDAMKLGAFDYVLKPFTMQTIMPVLTRAVNMRHLRLENLQLRETVAIYGLSQTIAFTLDPQAVISKLADAALQQTEADEVSILLPTSDGTELYVAAVRGEHRQRLLGERVPLDQGISGWVARERAPLILNGEVRDERFQALWPHPEILSAISVPMQVANKLVGTINLNAVNRPRPFTLGQMKALTILASTAAGALESASLYGQVRRAEEKYRSIFENAIEGIFQSTPEGRFIAVNPSMARILGYDSPKEVVEEITNAAQQLHVHPESHAEAARLQEERSILQGFEFEAYRKDGEKIWLSVNRRRVQDENGGEIYCEGSIEDITERKRAQEALSESEERYKGLIDSAFDGVVIHRERTIVSANRAYAEMFGYCPDEVIGMEVLEFTAPEYRDFVRTQITQGESTYESVGLRKNGSRIPIEISGQICLYQGQPARLSAMRDITERKRVEELQARRAARALFRADVGAAIAVSRAPLQAMLELCAEAMVQHLNAAFARVWTLNREEDILELQASAGIYTHVNGPHSRVRVGAFKIGKIAEERLAHITNDVQTDPRFSDKEWAKREGMVAFAGYPLVVQDRLLGVMAMFSRVELAEDTLDALASVADLVSLGIERKRGEQELRESEERYRDLVENAHDMIYSHDLQGRYTSMNRAGERITGYTREEILALDLTKTVAPEHIERVREMLTKKLDGERVTAYEMEMIAKDGHRVTVEVNTKLVFHDGVPFGVQGIARDVTERKHLEEQFRQSQKMEAIGQLAGGIAHDFNNLLTAITGYSSLGIQHIDGNDLIRTYFEEIKKAGDRAANLTRQLLAFGRKQILQPLPLNLNDIVSDMNKMLRRLIGEDIDFSAKLDPGLERIKADPGQIEQVLVNLVVNARDAMPQGGDLTIETSRVDLDQAYADRHVGVVPGSYVMLAVSDTGTGMDDDTRARIFDPFFTTKEKGKGTGLGLSTVYGIVKQSGGSIWVYSEPGHGTTFKVYFPELAVSPQKTADVTVEPAMPGGSETILLVEDEDVVRSLARKILEHAGYNVLDASRGEEAVRMCQERAEPIDLLLTDIVMPETSGKGVADRLCEMLPGLRVLFMSGYTDEAIVHHGVLDSNVEFIQKPFTPADLAKKVREVLDSELVPGD